jgi:uncharacterized membrane protein YvbJ
MRCSYCGRSNRRGAELCASCGAPMPLPKKAARSAAHTTIQPLEPGDVFPDPDARRKAKVRMVAILLAMGMVAVVAVLVFFLAR